MAAGIPVRRKVSASYVEYAVYRLEFKLHMSDGVCQKDQRIPIKRAAPAEARFWLNGIEKRII
jgi:hypothetical protein